MKYFSLASLSALATSTFAAEWNYIDQDKWSGFCNDGMTTQQSPIHLPADWDESVNQANAEDDPIDAKNMAFDGLLNWDHDVTISAGPSAHSITYNFVTEPEYGNYRCAQFHFHLGTSEHSMHTMLHENMLFDAEVHFVCYKKMFEDLTAAVVDGKSGNLAVLGFFIHSLTDEIRATAPEWFNEYPTHILDRYLDAYHNDEGQVHSVGLNVDQDTTDMLRDTVNEWYRYEGGLTTPTCNPVVTWTVFQSPVWVDADFPAIIAALPDNLQQNSREVMPREGREITFFQDHHDNDGHDHEDTTANPPMTPSDHHHEDTTASYDDHDDHEAEDGEWLDEHNHIHGPDGRCMMMTNKCQLKLKECPSADDEEQKGFMWKINKRGQMINFLRKCNGKNKD